jgi:hypothetical protein
MHAMLWRTCNLPSDALGRRVSVTVVVTGREGAREVVFCGFPWRQSNQFSVEGDDATDQGIHHPCITINHGQMHENMYGKQ